MTIAVAVKKGGDIVLASDSQTQFGDQREVAPNHSANKIIGLGASRIAIAGWALYSQILEDYARNHPLSPTASQQDIFGYFLKFWKGLHTRYPFVNDQCEKDNNESPFGDLNSEFLLANRRGIFKICSNMSVVEFNQYATIGSGGDYALGSLFALYPSDLDAEVLARRAVDAAVRFDTGCGGEACVSKIKLDAKFKPNPGNPAKLHTPHKGKIPITPEFIDKAKLERRA